jgi:hypothetical protein
LAAQTFPYGGSYSGWFKLAVGPNKETKLEEKDVYIFFNRHRERNGYNVSGKGHNNYGPFQIYGRATKTSESSMEVELFREYGPPEPKPEGAARAPRPSGEARPRDRKSGGGASAALIRKPAGGSPGGDLLVGAAARAQQKRLAVQMKVRACVRVCVCVCVCVCLCVCVDVRRGFALIQVVWCVC